MSPDLYWVAVALTTVIATSRLTRLWTYDDFPPVAAVRNKYLDIAESHFPGYAPLGFCPWCVGFWIALVVIGTGYLCDVYGPGDTPVGNDAPWFMLWWFVCGGLTASYLGAMLMVRDGDNDDEDEAA